MSNELEPNAVNKAIGLALALFVVLATLAMLLGLAVLR